MNRSASTIFGTVLVACGLIFLLDNFDILDSDWIFQNLWPLGLVLVGVWLLVARSRRMHSHTTPEESDARIFEARGDTSSGDHIDASEVFGSIRRDVTSKNFSGGRCSSVFGDIRLDLTHADLLPGEQVLRFNNIFGAVRIELPRELEYSVKASLVAGGVNVKGDRRGGVFQNIAVRSNGFSTAEKRLAIIASSTFGEIKIL